jgi:hypothetical protein
MPYDPRGSVPTVSAKAVLRGKRLEELRGRTALVGATAVGTGDAITTVRPRIARHGSARQRRGPPHARQRPHSGRLRPGPDAAAVALSLGAVLVLLAAPPGLGLSLVGLIAGGWLASTADARIRRRGAKPVQGCRMRLIGGAAPEARLHGRLSMRTPVLLLALAAAPALLPSPAAAGCATADVRWTRFQAVKVGEGGAAIMGEIFNDCAEPVWGIIRLTFRNKGEVVDVQDIWPAGRNAIPPKSAYPVSWHFSAVPAWTTLERKVVLVDSE